MTSRRAQKRRALERTLDALEADSASRAYAVRGIHGRGGGGRDRRTAQEYSADLVRETERSLRRDPKRWTRRRTNEIPKDRSAESEGPP